VKTDLVREEYVNELRRRGEGLVGEFPHPSYAGSDVTGPKDETAANRAPLAEAALEKRKPGRPPLPDEHYAWGAQTYKEAIRSGEHPIPYIQQQFKTLKAD
jgi:hypothetical protein